MDGQVLGACKAGARTRDKTFVVSALIRASLKIAEIPVTRLVVQGVSLLVTTNRGLTMAKSTTWEDSNSIRLDEVAERGAYCTKCSSKLKLITNQRLDFKWELVTICHKCDYMTRTVFVNTDEL